MRLPNICGLLTASALLIGANSANALILEIDDLATVGPDITVTDPGNTGLVNFAGAVGVFSLVVSTGLGAPNVGGPGVAEIDLSVQASSTAPGALQVTLTDTGLSIPTGPTGGAAAISDLGINALNNANAVVESFIRVGGGVFEALSSLSNLSGNVDLVETILGTINAGTTFDLRTVITLTHGDKFASSSADANLNLAPVPLPAALPLFLTALVGLGFVGRQRRRQAA